MIDTPQIVQTTAHQAAVIRLTIPRNEMGKAFGPAVQELMTTLADQGVKPVGAVFAHHLRLPPDMWDFELGVETASPVRSSGRVNPGQLPAAKVARTVYRGPYDGLPGAWGDFVAWMNTHGHEQAEDLWEVYLVGPHSSADPANWRTELNRPLKT